MFPVIDKEIRSMLGYSESELKNRLEDLVKLVPPECAKRVTDSVNSHLNDKSSRTPFRVEHLMRFKDGEYRWVDTYGFDS